jgi:hypothetical protein
MTKTGTADLSTDITKARAQLQSLETAQQEQQAREAEALRQRQLEYLDGLTQEIDTIRKERSDAVDRLNKLSAAKTLDIASLVIAFDTVLAIDAKAGRLGSHEASVRKDLHGPVMNNIGAQVGPRPKITANYEPRPMIISQYDQSTSFSSFLDRILANRRQTYATTADTEYSARWWNV